MSLEFDFKKRTGTIIKVIGVGGGGGNAVGNMYREGIKGQSAIRISRLWKTAL